MTKAQRAGLLLLMLLPLTAQAQGTIVIERGDQSLEIKGWIGDDNSFIGNIGVTLEGAPQGSNAIKLNIYKSDLKTADGTETISRQLVAVTGDATLTPGATSTYQVKVTGVTTPGKYSGKIYLTLPGQSRDDAKSVDVNLVASVRPALSLMTENDRLQANLVNCKYCGLARVLLPAAAFQNKMDLGFEKPVAAPIVIRDVAIVVKGEQTRFKVDADKLKISLDQLTQPAPAAGTQSGSSLTEKKYLSLPVSIASQEIPADHYSGSIYLSVAGQTNALKVPVDFNVRSGPLWPLLVLLGSILLGRLFKFMQDKGNAIADALEAINRLEFRLHNFHPDDAAIVRPMLAAARDLVHQEKAAEALTAANAISARLSALAELRQIEARLVDKEPAAAVEAIKRDIREARDRISLQQDDAAKALVTRIKDALVALARNRPVSDSGASDLADAIGRADSASAAIAPLGTVSMTTGESIFDRIRRGLVMLSGLSDEFRTEATLFLARPILALALLIGLLALGLKTLYVDNAVFGANAFTDFLGLAFWGLSSEVASRTLSGLKITSANRPSV